MLDFKLRPEDSTPEGEPNDVYDLIILGGGPAGLAAGLYAARAGLSTLLIEKGILGGQIALTANLENFPGCIEGMGADFIFKLEQQASKFGAKITYADVLDVNLQGETKTIGTSAGRFLAKAVTIATGTSFQKLEAPGEEKFRGRGVSFCATCDGAFYRDKVVAVIGGGDAAVEEGDFLTRFASKVIIIHRRDALRATKIVQDRAFANPKIEFRWNSVVEEIVGDETVNGLVLRDVKTGERSELPVDGVFVFIGTIPNTQLFKGQVTLNPQGFVPTDEKMATNVPGVFAAGDVRQTPLRQVVTATADGAIAAVYADRYIHGE
ncbi:MAG: thioredoxin-disulfide reductase [Chloroflexi bacterium]|nr:thioredoxin-disulfide reductase [Chloroflexota bacterium]MDA8187250.1 thioredoxin-disulfide reductase [Dehalococcoidales bacterium]